MKKLIVGSIAVFVAAASFATSADAGVVLKYKSGWRRPAVAVVVRPRIRVYSPGVRVYAAPCIVKKRVNAWGTVVKKRVC
jgi:hypothetical protein